MGGKSPQCWVYGHGLPRLEDVLTSLISASKNWHCAATHNGDLILRNIGLLLVGGFKHVLFSLNSSPSY